MGLGSVLQSPDTGDRLGRDGFKMSEDWQSSHTNGFVSGSTNAYVGQHNQTGDNYMHRGTTGYGQHGEGVPYPQQQHGGQHGHSAPQEEYGGAWYSNHHLN